MLKHKDRRAMNLNDFVVLPNSAAKSVKLNARNLQELKTETGSLAQESDEMEEKLKRLKERMSQEKEQRTSRWKCGQHGLLNNAPSSINSKRNNDSRLQKLSAGKVKILQEELPTVQPPPPSPATVGTRTTRRNRLKGSACGQCEVRIAGVKCAECSEDYCVGCFSKFHQKGALKFHSAVPIQTELQTHVSTQDVVSRLPIQPNPSCNPATFSNPNPRPNPAHNHGASADAFADQRPGNAAAARHMQIQDNSSQILIVHGEEDGKADNEPSLLIGAYDEEESAKSFQEALRQWREAAPTPAQLPMWTPLRSVTVSDVPTQADLSPGGGGAGPKVPVRVEFAEHGLTLMDRLLLKKHRRTPVELPPPVTDAHEKPLPRSPEKELEPGLTAEDQEVHSYLTSLFAAPTARQRSGLAHSAPGVCLTIEVLDEEDKAVNAETKSLVNRIIPFQQAADPQNRMSSSHDPAQVLILSRKTKQTKTSPADCPALSVKPEPNKGTRGNRCASIKTASSKSKKPTPRCRTSHDTKSKSRGSLQSPLLSSSAPLYRRTHNAPFPFPPNDSPSMGRSSASGKSDSNPNITPVLRTTFTLTPSSSVESALLPKASENYLPGRSHVKSPRQFQQDAAQSDNLMSPSPSSASSRNCHIVSDAVESSRKSLRSSMSMQDAVSRSRLSHDGTQGNAEARLISEHETADPELQSERYKHHFVSDLSLNDSRDDVLTRRNEAVSTGYAKESTFALIQEYRNALKSIQDSEDEMSSDSLELTRCEGDDTDEDAEGRLDSDRSRDDRGNPASIRLAKDFVPAHKEGERDLPTDEAQQLSEPARVHSLWLDSDDSSDDDPPYNYRNLHAKNFNAMHQSRTSLDTSTPAELSQAAMLELSGCEDPDIEADTTNHTLSRLERELRLLARETGPEVFAAAPGNSTAHHPRGNRLYTRRNRSKEEQDEEEALLNDHKSVLLLP